jgi:hypothetical protein
MAMHGLELDWDMRCTEEYDLTMHSYALGKSHALYAALIPLHDPNAFPSGPTS